MNGGKSQLVKFCLPPALNVVSDLILKMVLWLPEKGFLLLLFTADKNPVL